MNAPSDISRRDFIKLAGTATAATCLGQTEQSYAASGTLAKFPVTCRDAHLSVTGKADCWAALKELGAAGAEVNVTEQLDCPLLKHPEHKYSLATAEGISMLKDALAEHSLRIPAFMMANRFDERLEEEFTWVRKLVKAAETLGVRVIRIDVVPRAKSMDDFLPFAIQTGKQLCQFAEGTSVRFGVENHGKCTNDTAFLKKLLDGVGSPKFGLTMDVANFYWFGYPLDELYRIYEQFAPHVVHTHCKSIRYPADQRNVRRAMGWEYGKYNCPIYEGDIEFTKVVAILRKANYQGDLCVEDESLGKFPKSEQADVLKKEITTLKRLALIGA